MLHQHLPIFISRLAVFARHAADLCQHLMRTIAVGLFRLQGSSRVIARGHEASGRRAQTRRGNRVPLFIHYHIFKNAGTSFEWALEKALGQGFRSFDSSSPRGFISGDDLAEFSARNPEVRAISSHQAAPPAPAIEGREVITSILIRDPIARIRSIYAFERQQQMSSHGAIKAKELDFKRYVEWRLRTSPAMLCNSQVHFCTRTHQNRTSLSGRNQLEQAIANLDTISIVGTVARYDEWIALAQKILSRPFRDIMLAPARRNVTAEPDRSKPAILEELISELGDATAQYLIENNELDMCLHQVADALLTRRLAEHGVRLTLHEAYSSVQQNLRLSRAQVSNLGQ